MSMKIITALPLAAAGLLTSPLSLRADVVVTSAAGFTIVWDGNDGDNFSAANPAPAPANLASAAGSTALASSEYGQGIHLTTNLNDTLYGNSNSWLGLQGGGGTSFAGIALAQSTTISSFAFGRDNGNSVTDPQANDYLGQLPDRCLGQYNVQITRVASPTAATEETGDAATGWQSIGTLDYNASDDTVPGGAFTAFFRHEYEILEGASAVQATGLRLVMSDPIIAIDEIELYGPGLVNPDTDGDGFDNDYEVALGFNPNDPLSTPESKADIFTAVEFEFHAAKNRIYNIEGSDDLVEWEIVERDLLGRGKEITRVYSTRGATRKYYRASRITAP